MRSINPPFYLLTYLLTYLLWWRRVCAGTEDVGDDSRQSASGWGHRPLRHSWRQRWRRRTLLLPRDQRVRRQGSVRRCAHARSAAHCFRFSPISNCTSVSLLEVLNEYSWNLQFRKGLRFEVANRRLYFEAIWSGYRSFHCFKHGVAVCGHTVCEMTLDVRRNTCKGSPCLPKRQN